MRDPIVVVAMLRFIVLFALVAGSIYAVPVYQSTTFPKGQKLEYSYNFQHVFADPGHSRLYEMINVETKVNFHGVEDDMVVLRFCNISIGPTAVVLNYPDPLLRMATEQISPAVYNERIQEIIEKLEIPIKFMHKDGTIQQIIKNVRDVDESVNIKRGLISFFEINTVGLLNHKKNSSKTSSEPVYLEKTVQGLCKTKYLLPTQNKLNGKKMEIVKIIDTDSCIIAPTVEKGLIYTHRRVAGCESRLKLMESSSTVRYTAEMETEMFKVTKAIGESSYLLTPDAPTEGRIALSLNQTLTFVKAVREKGHDCNVSIHTGLIGELPKSEKTPFPKLGVVEKIISLIRSDVQARHVNDIILLAEYLDLVSLRTIWDNTRNTRGYLVIDIFTKVDSFAMRQFLREKLPLLSREYWSVISDIALFQSPDELLLNDLLEVVQTGKLSIEQKQHLILNIGAYANKFVVLLHKTNKEITSGTELVKQAIADMGVYYEKRKNLEVIWKSEYARKQLLVTNITKHLEKVTKTLMNFFAVEPVFCLKAMGNMGWEKTIDNLLAIINNASAPICWRTLAVDSLRKMSWTSVEKILKPLLTLYVDVKESTVLRTKIFLLLTKYELPETTIMALLLAHQKTAPEWVGPFVYKYLSAIAKSKLWCLKRMSAKANKIVTVLEAILPMHLKERMSIPYIYEQAHDLWRKLSSLLVWHVSLFNRISLSSAALDLQIIPGIDAPETTIIVRIRSSSLATNDDVGMEIWIPHTVAKLIEIIKMRNWTALTEASISLKRNDLELRVLSKTSRIVGIPQILSLIWNVNSRRIPTASGGFLFVDQKSTVVGRIPLDPANKNLTVTSECHVNAYINAYFMHIGAGMKTAVKLYVPARLKTHSEVDRVTIQFVLTPTEKTINPISIEQVPYTLLRQFLPEYYKRGQLVVIDEIPLIICEKATDVNYIEITENLTVSAQLPMTDRYPQDIITTVWYGIHSINVYLKDEQVREKTWLIVLEGRMRKELPTYILETGVSINGRFYKQNTSISLVPDRNNLIGKITMDVNAAGNKHSVEGEISIPWLKPLPARCLFSDVYQNITRGLLHKVDISQPCLIRSQIETIAPQYTRIWKKLTSFGLLNIDETEHNIIAELSPEYITGSIKPPLIGNFFMQVQVLKIVKEFNEAAFQPLLLLDPKIAAGNVNDALLKAHKIIKNLQPLDPSAELRFATFYHAVLYEMMAIHQVGVNIFKEALEKISNLYEIEIDNIEKLNIHEYHIKMVKEFKKVFDPLIEKKIVTLNDKELFEKIREVEELLISGTTESSIIQTKTNAILTLIPRSFDPDNEISDILFLRARHLVSHSIVFKPSNSGIILYEFWHLRQDITMYFSLKQELIEILPCTGKLMCQMRDLIIKEFNLFHNAASYKRVALKAFISKDTYHAWVNELMLEFDDLLNTIKIITAELKIITAEISLVEKPNIAIVKTWYRLTTASEWSAKLLEEDQVIWHNINEYGMIERTHILRKLQERIIVLWNNLKISGSCKSGIVPVPLSQDPNTTYGECVIPESLNMIATLKVNSKLCLNAQVTAKKSLEQLIYEHDQSIPGFRAETSYRYLEKLALTSGVIPKEWTILSDIMMYLEKLGLRLSSVPEEWNIFCNINSYRDIQVDVRLIKPTPVVMEILSNPAWMKVARLLKWPLLKYWQIEDWKTALPRMTNETKLPTIRIIQYMDRLMADILIIRPTITESFLEVPVLTIPMAHLPKWIEPIPVTSTVVPVTTPTPTPVIPTKVPTVPVEPTKVPTVTVVPTKITTVPVVPTKVTTVPVVPTKVTTVPVVPTKVPTVPVVPTNVSNVKHNSTKVKVPA